MSNYKQLRQFTSAELLFNEEETRIVLKFIFTPVDHSLTAMESEAKAVSPR